MDTRGIEVINQLRSAIRAKLLELGVRYDEELPDYILVMVVNKKTRQQMHEDLHLFLEESTTPFVEWLHDQVLKKLQKVTVAKKKSLTREFVPTVVVKQEEERRKRKTSATSFLEDQAANQSVDKLPDKSTRDVKLSQKSSASSQDIDESQIKNSEKCIKSTSTSENKVDKSSVSSHDVNDVCMKKASVQISELKSSNVVKAMTLIECHPKKPVESQVNVNTIGTPLRNAKRTLDMVDNSCDALEKSSKSAKQSKSLEGKEEPSDDDNNDDGKKLKSSINKPRITSVVSVKKRLGIITPRNKFEIHRERGGFENRYRQSEKRFNKHTFEFTNRRNDFVRGRNFDVDESFRRSRDFESRSYESDKINDIKNRLGSSKEEKLSKCIETKEKGSYNLKAKAVEKPVVTIKDRLGMGNSIKTQKQIMIKDKGMLEEQKDSKFLEQERLVSGPNKNVKNRLGPMKNNFRSSNLQGRFNPSAISSQSSDDDDCLNLGAEEDLDDDAQSVMHSGPVKSHIVAVKRAMPDRTERKKLKLLEKEDKGKLNNIEDEDVDDGKIASKVIVTPRPLKPLQPVLKRATQSLLLRAVAEANLSVVTQKNPEPVLTDKKPVVQHIKPLGQREVGQNLSVRLNASKRLVMEKIQVELSTEESLDNNSKSYVPQAVTEEQMGVVMSLFQRSDDNQKFLVTLNGYNNMSKEKNASEDEERLEVEVNEDDEFALANIHSNTYVENDTPSNAFQITDVEDDVRVDEKQEIKENNENHNTENVESNDDVPRKKRKLSPIVYNRSRSSSPIKFKPITSSVVPEPDKCLDKQPSVDVTPLVGPDKSREKCRYWPNCTLGNTCAYYHPTVPCSMFPACKFGDKCAYRHPKCKFGLSCTKLGCAFSHPTRQCKYHPYCTKPACQYSHPLTLTTSPVEVTSQRAKFTWRRRD